MNGLTPLGGADGRVVLDAERLKQLRKQLGLSQSALAERCFDQRLCVSIASIKRAETGKAVLYRTARHLATLYAIDLAEVALGDAPPDDALPDDAPPGAAAIAAASPDDDLGRRRVIGLFVTGLAPALHDHCAALVRQFGGVLADAAAAPAASLLAVFGVPRAYRSDGMRCMQCALEMAAWLGAQPGGQQTQFIIDSLHWPITATGLALPAESSEDAPGLTIRTERGLTQLVADQFVFAPGEGHFLRYSARLRSDQLPSYALIGREIELRQLTTLLEAVVSYQAGHIVYIRGVAGIGKTRLSQEFTDMAQQHMMARHTGMVCDFGDQGQVDWLGQLICSMLRLKPESGELGQQLSARLQALRLPADYAMFFRPPIGLPQIAEHAPLFAAMAHGTRHERQREALHTLLLRETIERPVVLLVEDVHWADSAALDLLGGLLQSTAELPVVWVLTSRLEQDPLDSALRPYLSEQALTVLDLAPLRSVAAGALTAQFPDADPGFRSRCVARAQGNPLFLTQLLLAGQVRVLPESLQNLVQSKLDQLDPPDRRALRAAAVIGQRFSLALLRAVLGMPDYLPEAPVRQFLIRQTGPGQYAFLHDLILQGIYEAMAPVQRNFLHAQLAEQYGASDPALCAQHLEKAHSSLAPEKFLVAIRAMISQHQYEKALELIQQCSGIDYCKKDDYALNMLAGQATLKMGLTQEARVHYDSAMQGAPSPLERLHAVLGLARTLNLLDELDAEEVLLDAALEQATPLGAHAVLAHLYYLKGNIYFPRGDAARCRELHTLALQHARQGGDVDMEVRALSGLGDASYAAGRMGTALDAFRSCVALCEQHGLTEIEASNRFMLATTRLYANDTVGALDDAIASAELGLRVGNRRAEIVSRLTASWLLLSLSRLDEAQDQVKQGLELARAMGAARFEAFLLESLARVHLARGQPELARHQIRSAWQIVERQRLHHFIGPWVLGTLALLEERKSERQEALRAASALLAQGCVGHNYYRFLVSAAEVCLLNNDAEQALQFAAQLEHYTAAEPCAWSDHHIELIRRYARWQADGSGGDRARLREQFELGARAGLAMATPRLNLQGF